MGLCVATFLRYALHPRRLMGKTTHVVAALEVGHAVLADQHDHDIDGVSITLSKETLAMLRTAAYTHKSEVLGTAPCRTGHA